MVAHGAGLEYDGDHDSIINGFSLYDTEIDAED